MNGPSIQEIMQDPSDAASHRAAELAAAISVPGLHFHDLRHTGNTFAAESGASLRDLMTRMGHDSMRAALIYQHNTHEADRKIARALERLLDEHAVDTAPEGPEQPDDGTAGVTVPLG